MSRMIVAIDLDDVCWDFVRPLLQKYNLLYNDNVHFEDITDWDIHQFLKPECKNVFELCTEGFFEELHIPQEHKEWLEALNMVADIRFVTAGCSETILWRAKLLKRELPFFKDYMLVKLSEKELFKADFLIDDNEKHTINTDALAFLIKKPWNNNQGVEFSRVCSRIIQSILNRGETNG